MSAPNDAVVTDEEIAEWKKLVLKTGPKWDSWPNYAMVRVLNRLSREQRNLAAEKKRAERAEAMLKKHEYGWDACNHGNGSCSPQCPECEREPDGHFYSSRPTDYMKYCEWANIIKNTPPMTDE